MGKGAQTRCGGANETTGDPLRLLGVRALYTYVGKSNPVLEEPNCIITQLPILSDASSIFPPVNISLIVLHDDVTLGGENLKHGGGALNKEWKAHEGTSHVPLVM